jgi:hypothetical protein
MQVRATQGWPKHPFRLGTIDLSDIDRDEGALRDCAR